MLWEDKKMDKLEIINRVINEHHITRGQITLIGEGIADLEAVLTLGIEVFSLSDSLKVTTEEMGPLQQTISALSEGIENHFDFEEKYLPPVLGKLLTRALVIQHEAIKEQIDKAKSMVFDLKPDGQSQEEIVSKKADIRNTINTLLQLIEEHATREGVILDMFKLAIGEQQKQVAKNTN
jgi:hemerythrin